MLSGVEIFRKNSSIIISYAFLKNFQDFSKTFSLFSFFLYFSRPGIFFIVQVFQGGRNPDDSLPNLFKHLQSEPQIFVPNQKNVLFGSHLPKRE